MVEQNEFENEPVTAVVPYVCLADEALRYQAEFERRAAEVAPPVVAARGTREWVSK